MQERERAGEDDGRREDILRAIDEKDADARKSCIRKGTTTAGRTTRRLMTTASLATTRQKRKRRGRRIRNRGKERRKRVAEELSASKLVGGVCAETSTSRTPSPATDSTSDWTDGVYGWDERRCGATRNDDDDATTTNTAANGSFAAIRCLASSGTRRRLYSSARRFSQRTSTAPTAEVRSKIE